MDFLKNHYEKIILTVLLVLFVLSLFHLISVIKTVQGTVTGDELKLPTVRPDYQPEDFSDTKFNVVEFLKNMPVWEARKSANPNALVVTQLVETYPIGTCPGCNRYIPIALFMQEPHKCYFCEKALPTPQIIDTRSELDTTGDGIPDEVAKKFGLDPTNPADGLKDMDGDGFPNWFEYRHGTLMNDPKSRPPLCLRLYVTSITSTRMPVALQRLTPNPQDSNDWNVQIEVGFGRNRRTRFMKLNDVFMIGRDEYKIIDCRVKKERVTDPQTRLEMMKDVSEVTIQSMKGDDKIVMVEGQPVFHPREQVIMTDISDNMAYRVMLGDSFRIGSELTGFESYRVVSVDGAKNLVQLMNEADNKIYDISQEKRFENPAAATACAQQDDVMMPAQRVVPATPQRPRVRR